MLTRLLLPTKSFRRTHFISRVVQYLVSFDVKFWQKEGHYKKSQRGYILPICIEFPTQRILTKIGI